MILYNGKFVDHLLSFVVLPKMVTWCSKHVLRCYSVFSCVGTNGAYTIQVEYFHSRPSKLLIKIYFGVIYQPQSKNSLNYNLHISHEVSVLSFYHLLNCWLLIWNWKKLFKLAYESSFSCNMFIFSVPYLKRKNRTFLGSLCCPSDSLSVCQKFFQ